ncbi:hypothetical protein [Enterobacter cloacae]|uniref:hypothetical protein n=1 Tax=Enterobacter cloacae TaxID=550 RepID=UPI0028E1ED5C|nr:hypothetical protein [Enterobacter cloacae]WNT38690.1 hypothetical protein RRL13_11495 [Enterobacter cloacae]HDR2795519.1 hypothetical protein [Enterobacter asburiae]HDR2800900.1 hypothetical protein [Enterobacter asburiae]
MSMKINLASLLMMLIVTPIYAEKVICQQWEKGKECISVDNSGGNGSVVVTTPVQGGKSLDVKDVMSAIKNTTDEQLSVEKAVITPTTPVAQY